MAEVTEIARQRVQRLVDDWDWPDPAILEDIIALGEDAVPALDELLTPELLADAPFDETADSLVYYALELLCSLGTPSAIPVFVNAYRHIEDEMVEAMDDAVKRLGPEAISPLLALVADPALTCFARTIASNGARHEARDDPARREQVGECLRAIVADYVERPEPLTDNEKDVVAYLISDLSDLAYEPARSVIEAAYEADRVHSATIGPFNIHIINREDVEELYRKGGSLDKWEPPLFVDDYRKRRLRHLEAEKREAQLSLLEPDLGPQPIVLDPKLGRNAPCWCGSGKKYKKCHLAQDEKDKVRL